MPLAEPVSVAASDLPAAMDHFDLPGVLDRFAGDAAILRRVMQAFADDFRHWEQRARAALAADDLAGLKAMAHSLKGGRLDDALRAVLSGAESQADIADLTEVACTALHQALAELAQKLKVQ
ncbi:MAG: hypothetical protein RL268_1237 [Pseudomonadota bacterium]